MYRNTTNITKGGNYKSINQSKHKESKFTMNQ